MATISRVARKTYMHGWHAAEELPIVPSDASGTMFILPDQFDVLLHGSLHPHILFLVV